MHFALHGHEDGEWIEWGKVQRGLGDHPIVYAALNSHGSCNDTAEQGRRKLYDESGAVHASALLVGFVSFLPQHWLDYKLVSLTFADVTEQEVGSGAKANPTIQWKPWDDGGKQLVEMGSQSWLDSSGAWAPERRNADHVHYPSPHLPGHMHLALAAAAKMADFVNQLAHKVTWGGRPNGPKFQEGGRAPIYDLVPLGGD